MDTTTKTVSCKLTTPELQKRKITVIAELKSLVLERKELPDGYSFTFAGSDETLDKLNTFIKTERMCCGLFIFQLTISEKVATQSSPVRKPRKNFYGTKLVLDFS